VSRSYNRVAMKAKDVDVLPEGLQTFPWPAPPRTCSTEMAIPDRHFVLVFRSSHTSYISSRNLLKLTSSL